MTENNRKVIWVQSSRMTEVRVIPMFCLAVEGDVDRFFPPSKHLKPLILLLFPNKARISMGCASVEEKNAIVRGRYSGGSGGSGDSGGNGGGSGGSGGSGGGF